MFAAARIMPRLVARIGDIRLLVGGVFVAFVGMAWLSRLSDGTALLPADRRAHGPARPRHRHRPHPADHRGVAGVKPKDAGAASGLVNVAQQLGGSLGLGILVTVFAAASRAAARHPSGASVTSAAQHDLAYAVSRALTGSAIFLALGLAVILLVMRTPSPAPAVETTVGEGEDELAEAFDMALD